MLTLNPSVITQRTLLLKKWSRHKIKQHKEDLQRVQELERCRVEALKELKKSSLYLYHVQAFKIDQDFLPLQFKGPTETLPIPDYMALDMEENKVKIKGRGSKIMNPILFERGKRHCSIVLKESVKLSDNANMFFMFVIQRGRLIVLQTVHLIPEKYGLQC